MHPVIKKTVASAVLSGTMDHAVESMIDAAAAFAVELHKLSETDPELAMLALEQMMKEEEREERKAKREQRKAP